MAIFSNKKGIREAKEAAGGQQHAAITAMEAADRERARGIAGEQAKMAVWGLLGSDPNSFTSSYTNTNNVDDPTSLFDTSGVGLSQPNQALKFMAPYDKGRNMLLGTAREGILDPAAYANAISQSAQFRIQSQRVRESEELLNQEGPAWDMLHNSVLGVINEGSALQLRETMRKLKNQYAKGGTARRTSMFEANELMAGERAMRTRVQETWQANLALYDSIRQNADRVAAGTQTFMQGLPLVNDSYRDAMQRTADLQIKASVLANNAVMTAYDTKMTQQAVNYGDNFVEGLVKLIPSIVVGALTGGAGVSVAAGAAAGAGSSSGTSALGQMFGGNPDAGYTARGYGPGAQQSTSDGSNAWMENAIKSGVDYIQSLSQTRNINNDLDTMMLDNPDLF